MAIRTGSLDVFIVGGGPAGLAAAIAARQKGLSVIVADGAEPPIDKACGEGMMPETQTALRDLGVELTAGACYRFRGIQFNEGQTRVAADFPEGWGIGVRRTLLHEAMIQHAEKCGVKLLWRTPVIGIAPEGVHLPTGTVGAKWVIGADGSNSRVRRWLALDAAVHSSQRVASRRHYRVRPWMEFMEIYWSSRSQAYVTPISGDEVCIVSMGETAADASFESMLQATPELSERLIGAEMCSRERGAITVMQSLAQVCRGNVVLVGDASGGVDAITGDGLRLAFRQAVALADAMERDDLRNYARVHRKLARRPKWMGRLMVQFGQNAGMRHQVLRTMRSNPKLFARFLAIHVGQATPAEVAFAGAQLGWQWLAG